MTAARRAAPALRRLRGIPASFECPGESSTGVSAATRLIKLRQRERCAPALVPAGVEKSIGIISASPNKDPSDPVWTTDKGVQDYLAFAKRYIPDRDPRDLLVSGGYGLAQIMWYILERWATI